jgi:hypothetical protein
MDIERRKRLIQRRDLLRGMTLLPSVIGQEAVEAAKREIDEIENEFISEVLTMSELKLEAGRYYRTRDGRKAYVVAVLLSPFGKPKSNDNNCVGFIEGDTGIYWWYATGHRFNGMGEMPEDLIDEWREPREWTVYVCEDRINQNVYPLLFRPGAGNLLARVTVREGEGVE